MADVWQIPDPGSRVATRDPGYGVLANIAIIRCMSFLKGRYAHEIAIFRTTKRIPLENSLNRNYAKVSPPCRLPLSTFFPHPLGVGSCRSRLSLSSGPATGCHDDDLDV